MAREAEKQLIAILKDLDREASLGEIREHLPKQVDYRTVLRWIRPLIEQGRVQRTGSGRSCKYLLVSPKQKTPSPIEHSLLDLPISEEGYEVYQQIKRPLEERKKVGYHREFLESYRPNSTFYLTKAERDKLKAMSGNSIEGLPAGTYARRVFDRLLIDLSWNSSRLEGNTYSLLETERLLALGESANDKSAQEAHMILNHKDAIEFLVENAEELTYSAMTVRNIHALLSDSLLGDPGASGRVRIIPVEISGTRFIPCNTPSILEECLQEVLQKAARIKDPFEVAFFLLVHLPYLQPFEDVNKRTSRLVCNIPLIKANLCPLSFVDVSTEAYVTGLIGIYELNRVDLLKDVFLWAYHRSTQRYAQIQHQIGEPDPLRVRHRANIRFLVKEVVENRLDRLQATRFIQRWAADHLEENGRQRFIEAVEQELLLLNTGNYARYKIRLSVFTDWLNIWNS